MRVKFLTATASPAGTWAAGEVADIPEALALALLAVGAVVAEKAETETAALPVAEVMTVGKPRSRGKNAT